MEKGNNIKAFDDNKPEEFVSKSIKLKNCEKNTFEKSLDPAEIEGVEKIKEEINIEESALDLFGEPIIESEFEEPIIEQEQEEQLNQKDKKTRIELLDELLLEIKNKAEELNE